MDKEALLRKQLVALLTKAEAHVDFEKAIADLPPALRGQIPSGADHSPWELVEHLRIALWDILEFSRNPAHQSPDWPVGYWPAPTNPVEDKTWDESVQGYRSALKEMCELVMADSTDLFRKDSPRRWADHPARGNARRRPQCLPRRPNRARAAIVGCVALEHVSEIVQTGIATAVLTFLKKISMIRIGSVDIPQRWVILSEVWRAFCAKRSRRTCGFSADQHGSCLFVNDVNRAIRILKVHNISENTLKPNFVSSSVLSHDPKSRPKYRLSSTRVG